MKAADSELGLWAKTIETAQKNIFAVSTYVGLMMVIGLVQDYMSSNSSLTFIQTLIAALLAIPVHLYVLTNQANPMSFGTKDNKVMWRFFWRLFLLGVIAFVPGFVALFLTAVTIDADMSIAIVIMALTLAITFPVVFAKWGTMLPASVVGADNSFAAASKRGNKTFGYSIANLSVSFLLLTALILAAAVGVGSLSSGDGRFISENGVPDAFLIGGVFIANSISAFQIVMTAVILSRAYMMAEKTKA